jgi:hypothetical protein
MNSLKDQLALLTAISSHIDFDKYENVDEVPEDFEKLLIKLNNLAKNLKDRHDDLKKLLEN